jgi:hypothetical protein
MEPLYYPTLWYQVRLRGSSLSLFKTAAQNRRAATRAFNLGVSCNVRATERSRMDPPVNLLTDAIAMLCAKSRLCGSDRSSSMHSLLSNVNYASVWAKATRLQSLPSRVARCAPFVSYERGSTPPASSEGSLFRAFTVQGEITDRAIQAARSVL